MVIFSCLPLHRIIIHISSYVIFVAQMSVHEHVFVHVCAQSSLPTNSRRFHMCEHMSHVLILANYTHVAYISLWRIRKMPKAKYIGESACVCLEKFEMFVHAFAKNLSFSHLTSMHACLCTSACPRSDFIRTTSQKTAHQFPTPSHNYTSLKNFHINTCWLELTTDKYLVTK